MADDYDFQINSLKFRAAVNDQMPYQRATAPFRKDQFDSAPTVGDQSLTGWWTRGQLSFHKGAGLKYYEVLDGETILNRYLDSGGVDVWTAGQASLIPNLADLAVAATSATPGTMAGVSGLFYTTPTGVQFSDGSAKANITTSNGGVPTAITSDGRYYLATNGARIERQSTTGGERHNYVTNPSFETGTAGWDTFGATLATDTAHFKYGTQSLKVTTTSTNGFAKYVLGGLTVGQVYVVKAWVYVPSGATGDVHFAGNDNSTSTDNIYITARDTWVQVSTTITALTASADEIYFIASDTGQSFYVDGVMVTEFPFDGDYFDGSTPGGSWDGTANASRSTYAGSSTLRTNHVTNPNFETGTTGWMPSTFTTLAVDTAKYKYGAQSMKITQTDATGLSNVDFPLSGLTAGATYVASAWLYKPTGCDPEVSFSAAGSGGGAASYATTRDAWVRHSVTFTATASGNFVRVLFNHTHQDGTTDSASGDFVYLDGVMVTEFPFEGDYFDGSTPGGSWTGTANASKSTYSSSDPAASFALWQHGDAGYQFQDIWYAKGRIWAVDNTGRWYTLAPTGGTIHVADAIWASGKTGGTWSLADSPSSIFIGEAGTIYSLSVDVDGGIVGGLTAPVVAATLPAGENISSLFHYLGYLVITTNKGVRVAVVQDSNLVYGPLAITGNFTSARGTGAGGSLVYVVGQPTDHSANTLCVLDLTTEVDQLRPAWAPWVQLNNTAATRVGALVDPTGRLFAWAGNLYGSGTTKAASGSITTGYHRFGTLDPKSFQTVSVRCGGTGGSITVYRVDANGTETSLGTITPAEASKDFALGLTAPTERIALKFVLTRDGTDSTKGPELLGYQLKAMPVPVRQRLMKWPLTIMDTFRLRGGKEVGKAGRAYSDIKALEALESSAAVVTFTDHRTGETGSAYIDSVEFQSDTPSSATTNGFGGVAYVTLRVLS